MQYLNYVRVLIFSLKRDEFKNLTLYIEIRNTLYAFNYCNCLHEIRSCFVNFSYLINHRCKGGKQVIVRKFRKYLIFRYFRRFAYYFALLKIFFSYLMIAVRRKDKSLCGTFFRKDYTPLIFSEEVLLTAELSYILYSYNLKVTL